MNVKIFLIILGFINPQEQESFTHYATQINELYEEVEAIVIERYPILHTLMGDEKPDFLLIVEFPNERALQQLFSSDEYKALVPYREKAFSNINVFISRK